MHSSGAASFGFCRSIVVTGDTAGDDARAGRAEPPALGDAVEPRRRTVGVADALRAAVAEQDLVVVVVDVANGAHGSSSSTSTGITAGAG